MENRKVCDNPAPKPYNPTPPAILLRVRGQRFKFLRGIS